MRTIYMIYRTYLYNDTYMDMDDSSSCNIGHIVAYSDLYWIVVWYDGKPNSITTVFDLLAPYYMTFVNFDSIWTFRNQWSHTLPCAMSG